MKKIVIIFLVMIISNSLFSQEVLINEIPDNLYHVSKWGKNRTNYIHTYGSYGMVVGLPEGSAYDIKLGLSREWKFGIRYKRRFSNHYAIGIDASISNTRYRFAQNAINVFPDTLMHDKEYISLSMFGFDFFNRINFGKRGDVIGKYVDFGVFGTTNYLARHNYWDKLSTPYNGSTKIKTTLYNVDYITNLQWGFKVRFGSNQFALWASYRMSNWINNKLTPSNNKSIELPRTNVGIEVGLF